MSRWKCPHCLHWTDDPIGIACATCRPKEGIMRLTITPADNVPPIGATANESDSLVRVKFFDPCGSWTWGVIEHDPTTGECFGMVHGFESELGSFDLAELARKMAERPTFELPIQHGRRRAL
jgi:hypothetical protein